ncbi:hypothetical protein CBL_20243, partial [Carabus blaptoides fortunei]
KEVRTTLDAIHALDEALEMKCRENSRKATAMHRPVVPLKPDNQPKSCPIYKWNFNFNGEGSVIEFLERIEELRLSRNATKLDLLNVASDLFTGSALLWYRANKGSLVNWDQLVEQLKKYYHPIDYDHRLWQEILQRKQVPIEHPSDFITSMQIPNLDSYYAQHVAAFDISTIDGLHQVCQRLELAKPSIRATSSTSLPTAYRHESRSSTSTVPSSSRQQSRSPSPRHVSFAVDSSCWNCKQIGHLYSSCRAIVAVLLGLPCVIALNVIALREMGPTNRLFDSGSSSTLLATRMWDKIKHLSIAVRSVPENDAIITANGTSSRIEGIASIPYEVNDKIHIIDTLLVSSLISDLLLGVDILSKFHIVPDIANKSFTCNALLNQCAIVDKAQLSVTERSNLNKITD